MANYPADATSLFTVESFTNMSDKKPDKGYSSNKKYNTIVFASEAGYEKRRLRTRRSTRTFSLKYTNVTGLEKYAIENFYDERSGNFQAFTFDLDHISSVGTVTTRFEGDLKVDHILSTGDNLLQNFYTVSFTLKETFD